MDQKLRPFNRPRKCTASGIKRTTDNPADSDEAILQPGGFTEEEDRHAIAADREETINLKKTSSCSPEFINVVLINRGRFINEPA